MIFMNSQWIPFLCLSNFFDHSKKKKKKLRSVNKPYKGDETAEVGIRSAREDSHETILLPAGG